MPRPLPRPSLHVLTDPALSRGRSHLEIAEAALLGGADVIQLRDKTLAADALRAVALEVADAVRRAGALFVVNDSVDVAIAADADGVHLGPDDEPVARARARWSRLLGASARTPDRARELVAAGADYLGVGPVRDTATKKEAPSAIGLEGLSRVVRAVGGTVPVIAIGGIRASDVPAVLAAGASGVAVVSSVVAAPDVRAAARALRDALDRARAAG
jgi:thiamine-phosphate pyrophosphorylase